MDGAFAQSPFAVLYICINFWPVCPHNELPHARIYCEVTMKRFCDIKSRNELADFLCIPRSKLTHILYVRKTDSYYSSFTIPKHNGKSRTICGPSDELMELQRKLATQLWIYQKSIWESKGISPNISHAFEKEKSIITNAKIHRNKRYVLNLDLEDFFDSFHFGRVQGYFEKNRYFLLEHEVAVVIAQIACYQGRLPQGAPSSPIITNLICQSLDIQLLKISKEFKLDYTRYADDLTFSTNDKHFIEHCHEFLSIVQSVIQRSGFKINEQKTRLQFRDSRQEVTGLIVNKKLNVSRAYVRETRAMAHELYTSGKYYIDGKPGTVAQLEGRFSFIDQLDHYNNSLDSNEIKHDTYHLNGRERQYQRFIFYKYLYANERPLIITEGKTDIRYIKAALKKMYLNYPKLIQKSASGKFIYNISFFRRSKRWKYFFGINQDGADSLRFIYYSYFGQFRFPEYFKYFSDLHQPEKQNPVMILFDNETKSERPLNKFLNGDVHATKGQKDQLLKKYYFQILNSNLYILTNPLVDNKGECEIEDLFFEDTLNLTLAGKTFCRKDKFDNTKFYGKDIFSQYIFENYETIDFSRFIPLLDAIDSLVK